MNANHQEMSQRMRIQCPSCSATYDVAAGLLEKPRTVRCAQCGQDWLATAMPGAEEDASVAAPAADPDAATMAPPTQADRATGFRARGGGRPSPGRPCRRRDARRGGHGPVLRCVAAQGADAARDRANRRRTRRPTCRRCRDRAAVDRRRPARVSGRRDRLLAPAWIVSISLLLAFFALGYVKRAQVMEHWPASKRAYAVLGLSPAAGEPSGEKH